MSVEDLTLDCQSDQEDQSAEKKGRGPHLAEVAADDIVDGAVGTGGHDDVLYLELFLLFHNLKSFECIYDNNALIDQEFEIRNRAENQSGNQSGNPSGNQSGNQRRTSECMSSHNEGNRDGANMDVDDSHGDESEDDSDEESEDDNIEDLDDGEGLDQSQASE